MYENKDNTNKMSSKFFKQAEEIVNYSIKKKVAHLNTINKPFHGNKISTTEGDLINFSLSDYLALSSDKRLIEGAVNSLSDSKSLRELAVRVPRPRQNRVEVFRHWKFYT